MKKVAFAGILLGFLNSFAFAKTAYEPNVYECHGEDMAVTFSKSAWHREPIFVIQTLGSVSETLKRQGSNEIRLKTSVLGLEVSIERPIIGQQVKSVLTLLLPKFAFTRFDENTSFDTILIKSTVFGNENFSVEIGENIYFAMKCRARIHLE